MSTARPITWSQRLGNYLDQKGQGFRAGRFDDLGRTLGVLTPRQRRRLNKKLGRSGA